MAAVLVILGIVCCCSSSIASVLAIPIPAPKSSDPTYDGFKEIVSGRVIYDKSGKAFTSGLEVVCADNCAADFTCNAFSTWTQNGQMWCLKSDTVPNPWMTLPEFIANKTGSKIYVKNN